MSHKTAKKLRKEMKGLGLSVRDSQYTTINSKVKKYQRSIDANGNPIFGHFVTETLRLSASCGRRIYRLAKRNINRA